MKPTPRRVGLILTGAGGGYLLGGLRFSLGLGEECVE